MSDADRERWDERYSALTVDNSAIAPPSAFAGLTTQFPVRGEAVDVACGSGRSSVWLAQRGLDVTGIDVSGVAVAQATALALAAGVEEQCRFVVADLDDGLPDGGPVALVLCHLFNAPWLDGVLLDRLAPGGLLAVAVLSEVGATPGRFRCAPGALLERFKAGDVEVVDHHEGDGVARLLARVSPSLS